MCIIIVKREGTMSVPESIISRSAYSNPDGLGIIWLDTLQVEKMDSSMWHRLVCNRPYVAHFRYATVGKVCHENTHPNRVDGTHEQLVMNGTISGLGSAECSDTRHLASLLGDVPRKDWKRELDRFSGVKFATVNTKSGHVEVYNSNLWASKGGVLYSNPYMVQDFNYNYRKQDRVYADTIGNRCTACMGGDIRNIGFGVFTCKDCGEVYTEY